MMPGAQAAAVGTAVATTLLAPSLFGVETSADATAPPAVVRVVNGYNGPADIEVALEDRPTTKLAWASATPWTTTNAGQQRLTVRPQGKPSIELTAGASTGCSTTVIILRASVTDRLPTTAVIADCGTTRIPAGEARITAFGSTVDELGPVEAHLEATELTTHPREFPVLERDLHPGPQTLAVGAPGTGEMYQRIEPDLQAGTSYTLLYLGGGETPAQLVLLQDAHQAPDPPTGPVHTGL